MESRDYRGLLPRALVILGNLGMLVGAVDLMEGSAVIFPSAGLVALGTYLARNNRRLIAYRVLVFVLVAFGVGEMWVLTHLGGVGGISGRSMWWGVLILPYLFGWSMGIWGPGSPRWVLWLGMAVSFWFLALAEIVHRNGGGPQKPMNVILRVVLTALGMLTIGGCVHRLRVQGSQGSTA